MRALPTPLMLRGEVIKGFGRGSRELGIPTANLDTEALEASGALAGVEAGIYAGWATVWPREEAGAGTGTAAPAPVAHKMVMSIGWCARARLAAAGFRASSPPAQPSPSSPRPRRTSAHLSPFHRNPFYKNERKTVEPHLLHVFPADFYGAELRLCVVGYLRPEASFPSLEALIAAIHGDIDAARSSLDAPPPPGGAAHAFLMAPPAPAA